MIRKVFPSLQTCDVHVWHCNQQWGETLQHIIWQSPAPLTPTTLGCNINQCHVIPYPTSCPTNLFTGQKDKCPQTLWHWWQKSRITTSTNFLFMKKKNDTNIFHNHLSVTTPFRRVWLPRRTSRFCHEQWQSHSVKQHNFSFYFDWAIQPFQSSYNNWFPTNITHIHV